MAQYVEVLIASTSSIIQHNDPYTLHLDPHHLPLNPYPYPSPLTLHYLSLIPHTHPRNRLAAWYLIL